METEEMEFLITHRLVRFLSTLRDRLKQESLVASPGARSDVIPGLEDLKSSIHYGFTPSVGVDKSAKGSCTSIRVRFKTRPLN